MKLCFIVITACLASLATQSFADEVGKQETPPNDDDLCFYVNGEWKDCGRHGHFIICDKTTIKDQREQNNYCSFTPSEWEKSRGIK